MKGHRRHYPRHVHHYPYYGYGYGYDPYWDYYRYRRPYREPPVYVINKKDDDDDDRPTIHWPTVGVSVLAGALLLALRG